MSAITTNKCIKNIFTNLQDCWQNHAFRDQQAVDFQKIWQQQKC